MDLEKYIRDIPDFPEKGILFKDITPLLQDPAATKECLAAFISHLNGEKIDKIIGIEARGFFFGILLANELNAGFVPVRKKGKLPAQTLEETYELEYGNATVEIHKDAIKPGERILIHDDILATGGTAAATCKLVERLGGNIIKCCFLMEIDFLKGRENLKNHQLISLLQV